MTWAAAAFLVVGFIVLLQYLRVPERAREIFQVAGGAVANMRDSELGDLEKEKAVQAAARRLLGLFLIVTLRSALALAVPLGIVAAAAAFELVDLEAALDRTLSWQVLVGATVLVFAWMGLARGRRA